MHRDLSGVDRLEPLRPTDRPHRTRLGPSFTVERARLISLLQAYQASPFLFVLRVSYETSAPFIDHSHDEGSVPLAVGKQMVAARECNQ